MAILPNEAIPGLELTEGEGLSEFITISRAELELLRAKAGSGFGELPQQSPKLNPEAVDLYNVASSNSSHEARLMQELTARDDRVAVLESACKSAVRDRELATMLAGKPLVAGAAAQLIKLWRDEFDVYEEEGAYKVATRDGRKPAQVVSEWLASSEYSHFCLPTSRGGTGARDASRPLQQIAEPREARNLGEAVVMKWREENALRSNSTSKSIGLRRHR